ncbi:butanediol dehydrogenase [Paenibacillus terrae]|uniref:Butanediol dehydrogenase n=1 Tax=Paenibacillus terrae TaxID=159743 RepID=A0A4U2Q0R2_9BACL|nr:2,3-butanediol dehydrogenase [Paenibacillus terrae]TKH44680.1 butanediol dehydrogenase [Paenibacillus terrae]
MKAAVIYGTKDVRVEEVQEPGIQPGKVKVKVEWAGICGSDLHAYHHGVGVSETPHPLTKRGLPLVLGHEFAGVVTEVGEGVAHLLPGDRVAVEPIVYSQDDYYVQQGKYNLANNFGFLGLQGDGGFAEFALVEAHQAHKLPDSVSLEEGALIEPTAVAVHAVRESQLKIGNSVVVFGAGPIGILTIIAAKSAGAAEIIAVDISSERLEKALEVGATVVINSANEDVTAQILSLHEYGVDIAYEAAGVQATFTSGLEVLKKGGQLVVVAAYAKPVTLDVNSILIKEVSIRTSIAYRHIFPEVIAMIAAGRLDIKKVITQKITLDRIVEDGLELLISDKRQSKILIDTQG